MSRHLGRTPRAPALVAVSLLLAAACSNQGTDRYACDICVTQAVVYGQVTSSAGTQVPNAEIEAAIYRDSVTAAPVGGTWERLVRTDAQGHYRGVVISPLAPFRGTLGVRATPPVAFGLGAMSQVGARVDLRAQLPGVTPDSVRVDFVLATSGTTP